MGRSSPSARSPMAVVTPPLSVDDDGVPLRLRAPAAPSTPVQYHHAAAELPRVSLLRLVGVTSFSFPYGCICSTMGLLILPMEAKELYPDHSAIALGGSLALVGVSQLVCPWAGMASDGCGSPWGRRRPYIAAGTAAGLAFLAVMGFASMLRWSNTYAVALFAAMVGLNVAYSAQCGLVPDLVPKEQHGAASGIASVHLLAGSAAGFGLVLVSGELNFRWCYITYAAVLALFTGLTCAVSQERQRPRDGFPGHVSGWRDALAAYRLPMNAESRDFLWVFVGRTCFYIAVSCQAFMQYYIHDVVGTTGDAALRRQMAWIVLIGQCAAGIVAFPAGRVSDAAGRKPLVYAACAVMCAVYVAFLAAPRFAPQYGSSAITWIYAISCFYGIGNGCYLSVDYALAIDCLPNKEEPARDLGVWGIAAFAGSAFGPLLWGAVLTAAGAAAGGGYSTSAYAVCLLGGCFFSFCAAAFVCFIRNAR